MTGLVLAGGEGRRLGGGKPQRELCGRPLAAYPVDLLQPLCDEVLLVGGTFRPSAADVRFVQDREPGRGPLGGLVSGLEAARSEWCLVLACDLPLMRVEVLELLSREREGARAIVPQVGGRLQPLAALYARSCLGTLEGCLREGRLGLQQALKELPLRVIPEEQVRTVDPELWSFLNVNTPSELAAAARQLPQTRAR